MNENQKRRGGVGDYIDHVTALKTLSPMFKVLLNEEGEERGNRMRLKEDEARAGRPQHCCIQTCVEAQKKGRLPS